VAHHDAQHALSLVAATAAKRDPTGADLPGNTGDALAALVALRELRDQLDAWEPQLIAAARAAGASWADLAPALGVASRQAAERRYLRLRHSDHDAPDTTREQRVEAERDRRAGQRAITAWARANGADLRQLAGQITALTDLGPDAQANLDQLHRALGGSDPATLLPLLADTHQHLPRGHAALAERISTVNDQTDRIRTRTRQRRAGARSAGRTASGRGS
jgi:hypothetical protein